MQYSSFRDWLISFRSMSQASSMLLYIVEFPSCLKLSNISLYEYTTLSLSNLIASYFFKFNAYARSFLTD